LTITIVVRGIVLGLSAGLFCAGFCVPLLSPLLLSRERTGLRHSLIAIGLFLLGRLGAYLLFGLVFGFLGSILFRVTVIRTVVIPAAYGLLGLLLFLYGLVQSLATNWGLCHRLRPSFQSAGFLLLFGFLAGINLCPPFLLALASAVDVAGPLNGVIFFGGFFLATTVWLLPLLLSGFVNRFLLVRTAARILAIITGLYFILLAAKVVT